MIFKNFLCLPTFFLSLTFLLSPQIFTCITSKQHCYKSPEAVLSAPVHLCARRSIRAKHINGQAISAGAIPSSLVLVVGLLPGHTCGIDYPPWLAAAFLPATHLTARVTEEMAKGFHSWNKLRGRERGGGFEKDKKPTLNSRWKKDGIS